MEWHKSKGIIKYDPERGKLKKKPDWWCVVECDEEITKYYRWWVYKETGIKLYKPSWGSHISVIRGEKPWGDLACLWKKYDGLEVEFEYHHFPRISGDTTGWDRPDCYHFIDIKCDSLMMIRREFDYPCNFGLHMTIGRLWNQ